MKTWLPPEILLKIVAYVSDISTLLALRQVNHDWSKAADTELERWACLSLDPESMEKFEAAYKKVAVRGRITDAAVIVPDQDYWSARFSDGSLVIVDAACWASFLGLREIFQSKIPKLTKLARLSFHIRPPSKKLAPMGAALGLDRNRFLVESLTVLVELLHKMGSRRLVNRNLKELSIQYLPVDIAYTPSMGRDWAEVYYKVENAIRRVAPKRMEIGLIAPTVWQSGNISTPAWTTVNRVDTPDMWLDGATIYLEHLSLSCWGFYIKHITGNKFYRTFPGLKTLKLRGCAFTSDKQINWLLSHKDTLQSLTLDDCPMVYKLLLKDKNPVKEDCDSVDMIIEKGGAMQHYEMTWGTIFERIRLSFPRLLNFQFGSSRVRQPGHVGSIFDSEGTTGPPLKPNKFLFGLFPDRYLCLADGTGKCEWILQPAMKPVERPHWVKNRQFPDRDALVSLVNSTGQVLIWNDTSDHAGYVHNLFGRVRHPVVSENATDESSKSSSTKNSNASSSKSSQRSLA